MGWTGDLRGCFLSELTASCLLPVPAALPRYNRLRNIQTLLLDGNEITLFPPPLCCLTSLVFLSVSENVLIGVDGGIGNLVNLVVLDLSYNKLMDLPVRALLAVAGH